MTYRGLDVFEWGYGAHVNRLPSYVCFLAAAASVLVVPAPTILVDLIGSDVWASLALFVVVAVVLFMLLIVLGLAAGKVGLPFGLSVERSAQPAGEQDARLDSLADELRMLREADERLFERIGSLAQLLQNASERIVRLEREQPSDPELPL